MTIQDYLRLFPIRYEVAEARDGFICVRRVTFMKGFGHYEKDSYHTAITIQVDSRILRSTEDGVPVYFALLARFKPTTPISAQPRDHVRDSDGTVTMGDSGW